MRLLVTCLLGSLSFVYAIPFSFEPRLELPAATQEYDAGTCIAEVSTWGQLGLVITPLAEASPQSACFVSMDTSSEAVSQHFESRLSELGYDKITENDYPPNLSSSKWTTQGGSVLSFIWLSTSPKAAMTLAFYNDGSMTREQAAEAVSGSFSALMEEAKGRVSIHLKQETRFSLPPGALELPADECQHAMTQVTVLELPLLSCYIVPLEVRDLLTKLENELLLLGYTQNYLAEEVAFTAVNWLNPQTGSPRLGLILAGASQMGGALLVEIDMVAMER